MCALTTSFPALDAIGYFDAELHVELVADIVGQAAEAYKRCKLQEWADRLKPDPQRQGAWLKKKSNAAVAFDSAPQAPVPPDHFHGSAVHPVQVISAAESKWIPLWTCPDELESEDATSRVQDLLEFAPKLEQASLPEVSWSGSSLLRLARRMVGKASGPDAWEAAHWLLLPATWWDALASLWQTIWTTGKVPALWKRARVSCIPKPNGDSRPLSLLCLGWRIGANVL